MKTIYYYTLLVFLTITMSNAQVGIGTTNPDATLHIVGTTVPGSVGGLVELLNEDFTGYTVVENNSSTGCTVDGWENTTTGDANVNCTSCSGNWLYIDSDESGCTQNATAIINLTTSPTNTTIDISFDYRYNNFGASGDSFRVYLYNNTLSSQQGANLINTTADANTSYSSSITVIASNSYSLRFEYNGTFDYGASLDNVLVTETSVASAGAYTFRLEDGQQQDGYVMTSDANGNATWMAPSGGGGSGTDSQTLSISGNDLTISNGNTVTIPSSGGGTYSFENGITESGGTVRLGGALTQATYIDLNSRDLYFEGTGTGDITFEDNSGQPQMTTNFSEGYTNFGAGGAFVDSDDGTSFSDTFGGGPFTKEFVLGAYNGSSGGTSIALGSIEYVVDGTNELFYEGGGFSPMDDFSSDLGADPFSGTTRRWDDVFADDFITPTNTYSRTSGKLSTTKDLNKGLSILMQLKPISYKDQMTIKGKAIPENTKEDKLGFYVEELLNVLPEAVKTSDWVSLDESGNKTHIVYNKPSGIKFTQIIPVTVKAIQEQQEQVEDLKSEVEELKKQIQELRDLINAKK
ncbi:hypothetical protein [Aurantibacter sp.]|uniref:hypothetical protein n=1 Tax=Aurantibacter sp. TaxID=2807103 RepID=UPI0035C802A4